MNAQHGVLNVSLLKKVTPDGGEEPNLRAGHR
jgi:hypothetical protein